VFDFITFLIQALKDKQIEADNEFEDASKSGNKDVSSSKEEPMEVDSSAKGDAKDV